jgi:hypothetical protein
MYKKYWKQYIIENPYRSEEIVVINGSGGRIKTYLLFLIINFCEIF